MYFSFPSHTLTRHDVLIAPPNYHCKPEKRNKSGKGRKICKVSNSNAKYCSLILPSETQLKFFRESFH